MTVVAALVTPEGAWIGADSLASDGDLCAITATPKIARFGGILVGFSGSFLVGQQVFRAGQNAIHEPSIDTLVRGIKTEETDWSLLCVEKGCIYEVNSDLSIIQAFPVDGITYGAIGSGAPVALGALYVDHEDDSSLMMAMEASAEHTTSVRGPFRVMAF